MIAFIQEKSMAKIEDVDLSFLQTFAEIFDGSPIFHDKIFFVVVVGVLAPFLLIGIAIIIKRRIKR